MLKIFLLSVVIFTLALSTYLFFYLGAYKGVEITTESRGPQILLYKNHIGAYHQIGPAIQDVETWAKQQNVPCPATFGEYLDNPAAGDQDRLRSRGGCILTGIPSAVPPDWKLEERPAGRFVVAQFSGSPAIGPFKVYPKIKEYLQEHRLQTTEASMEIYLINGSKVVTEYLFPLAQ